MTNCSSQTKVCSFSGAAFVRLLVLGAPLTGTVNVSFAVPLAMFGALHLFGPQFVRGLVPAYMPGRMFWVYFVGFALIAASDFWLQKLKELQSYKRHDD